MKGNLAIRLVIKAIVVFIICALIVYFVGGHNLNEALVFAGIIALVNVVITLIFDLWIFKQ